MKFLSLLLLTTATLFSQANSDYPIKPVPFTKVHINDGFWFDRIETNRKVTIPASIKLCEETGRTDNFAIACGLKDGEFQTKYSFDDSDVYKTIEGASYSLMLKADPHLERKLDSLISLIGKAQEEDGYLFTARTMNSKKMKNQIGEKRFSNLRWSHELYSAGHMYEAAVAHYMATNKKAFIDIAIKNADYLVHTFGEGKLQIPPGHQEIELGLVKLYRLTGKREYLNLAKFFLDIRGKKINGRELWGEYCQDHIPVIEQTEAVGHSVRAAYMYSAMADIAAITSDKNYMNALDKIWENVVHKKIYLNGGLGSTGSWEGFGKDYELPNASAYNETCASIANIFWNHRMFLLKGEGKYIDVLERTLYNGLLSGIGISGNKFFYPNVLQSFGTHERASWFECACCPPNVTRLIASIAGYMYAASNNDLYVNLYSANNSEIQLNSSKLKLTQQTNYPWSGVVKLKISEIEGVDKVKINLRIPGWARNEAIPGNLYYFVEKSDEKYLIKINGKLIESSVENGYAALESNWKPGDEIELNLPMPIRRVAAHPQVEANKDRVALQVGPLVYAAEWIDNNGYTRNLLLNNNAFLEKEEQTNLLNGMIVIKGKSFGYKLDSTKALSRQEQTFTAIPYYAWAHRGKGEMSVWIANNENAVRPLQAESILANAKISVSNGKNPEIVSDGLEPVKSNDNDTPKFHWWPSKGTTEWIRFEFDKKHEISSVDIYWFDDTGEGECRIPKSWKVFYLQENDEMRQVYATNNEPYGVQKDKYNSVEFETVNTSSIKIVIESQPNYAGGIYEIKLK
jgi:DUF1680 family protein